MEPSQRLHLVWWLLLTPTLFIAYGFDAFTPSVVKHTAKPVAGIENPAQKPAEAAIVAVTVTPTPEPTPAPTVAPTAVVAPQPVERALPQSRPTGTKYDWMAAAGIPQSDWTYVDFIVTRESGWNPNAVNPSSGACGLGQQLPCGKWPGAWNDPVAALRAQHSYVVARYGSYAGAYAFWQKNHWY